MSDQHTAARPPERTIIERKIALDGSSVDFACTLSFRGPGLAVVRFALPGDVGAYRTPVPVPPRAVSFGYFWSRRPYNTYRILTPTGDVVAHRFDAVTAVRITAAMVSFRDLLLDWWALPDGTLIEEDREEFERAAAEGRITGSDLDAAERARRAILSRYRHIIDEVAALEARHGLR
ncbi:MAG: hypothetical protein Kow0010_14820 [Dehalococcoidia bacterium]